MPTAASPATSQFTQKLSGARDGFALSLRNSIEAVPRDDWRGGETKHFNDVQKVFTDGVSESERIDADPRLTAEGKREAHRALRDSLKEKLAPHHARIGVIEQRIDTALRGMFAGSEAAQSNVEAVVRTIAELRGSEFRRSIDANEIDSLTLNAMVPDLTDEQVRWLLHAPPRVVRGPHGEVSFEPWISKEARLARAIARASSDENDLLRDLKALRDLLRVTFDGLAADLDALLPPDGGRLAHQAIHGVAR